MVAALAKADEVPCLVGPSLTAMQNVMQLDVSGPAPSTAVAVSFEDL